MFFGVRSGFNWGAFEFLTEDFFVLDLMEDGEKSSSQAIVDGYDFDTVDYVQIATVYDCNFVMYPLQTKSVD